MTDYMERLREMFIHSTSTDDDLTLRWAIAEIERLRAILSRHHIDPDRCQEYPKGEQCALKAGHKGGHKWATGD